MQKKIQIHSFRRIGIDARFYGPVGKGLGRYTKEVVDRIIKKDMNNHYIIFLSQGNFDDFKTAKNVKKVLVKSRWYSVLEQIELPFLIWKNRLDLMHFPHFNIAIFCPVSFVVTIHDLILTKFPTLRATKLGPIKYFIKNLGYKAIINAAIKKSRKIIAVSQFTRDDIIDTFKIDKDKVVVTLEGVTNLATSIKQHVVREEEINSERDVLKCYNISKPYLFYVGNAYPHKNLERLLDAFEILSKKHKDLSLVLVGKKDYFYRRLEKYQSDIRKNKNVIFTGFVSDEHLSVLYKKARIYIFPSLYEGFGLPPLEAMMYGLPVISSDRASMPEVLGDAARYFDPENVDDMVRVTEEVLLNKDVMKQMRQKGLEQIGKYSWDKCANGTLEVYLKEINQ